MLLTNPGASDQYPIVHMFYVHDFRECMTGIFSLVTADGIIKDSGIIDITPYSNHNLPELSICDSIHVRQEI